jgi:hypothetical protein
LLTQLMGQKQCLPPDAQPVFLLETIPWGVNLVSIMVSGGYWLTLLKVLVSEF